MVTTSSLRFSKTFLPSTSSITRSVWLLVNIGRVVSGSLPSPKSIQNCIPWYPRGGGAPLLWADRTLSYFQFWRQRAAQRCLYHFQAKKGKLAVFIATRSCSGAEIQQHAILAAPLNGSDDLNKPDDSRRWNHTNIMWIRLLLEYRQC